MSDSYLHKLPQACNHVVRWGCSDSMHFTFQAQTALPDSQAASSNQGQEARRMPLGIRPGTNVPGMYPTYQHPAPPGVRPSQPGPGPAQLGTVPSPDPAMALVRTAHVP